MAGLFANGGKPLGKLRGIFFTTGENRNDYPCSVESAKNAESDELAQEKIATGGIIGRLDHTNHNPDTNPNDETLMKESAVNMRKFPTAKSDGSFEGECLILDTPDGQKIYAYCKSGKKPGISYRGGIDSDAYAKGDIEGAWRQFTVEGFDIVMVPAYKECYLELVEDYIDPDSDVYVEFKEEYLDNDAFARKASRRRASLDANGAAKAMIMVAASKKGAKEMAKVMAQEKHFTESEMAKINEAIDAQSDEIKRRTKEQAKELGTPYDAKPKHTWVRQDGNNSKDMHHEEAIYGEDDVDPYTGQKIETLNTGVESEEDTEVYGIKTDKQKTKASLDKKAQELAEEVAEEMVNEELEKKKETKAGVEKGTVADKEKDEDEELEGYIEKGGKVVKPVKSEEVEAGVLGVQSEEETSEDKKKKGDLEKDGKISELKKSAITHTEASLGVKAEEDEPEVELLTEDGIKKIGTEIVEDESGEDIDDEVTMKTLVAEITKLTEEVAALREELLGKDEALDNRNTELEALSASYKRLKQTTAGAVEKSKEAEKVQASLERRASRLAQVLSKLKKDKADIEAENTEHKKVIASYEKERSVNTKAMAVQASALRQKETEYRVLAGKNDRLGRLCIARVAETYGIDEGKLLASRGQVKTSKDLEKVIASLQRVTRGVSASYYPVTEGMQSALPDGLMEACMKADWNEEEEI